MENIDTRIIKKRYIFTAVLLVVAGIGLITIPDFDKMKEKDAREMLPAVMSREKSFSAEKVAEMIIGEDPLLRLIDVRSPEEFAEYSLPGAINIPLADILSKEEEGDYKWGYILNQNTKTNIFYSNGDIYATRAWFLCTRLNFKNNYILEGGLNTWFKNIIRPEKPENASLEEMDLYNFRLGARQYFLGGDAVPVTSESDNIPAVPVKKKKAVVQEEGGC